MSKLNRKIGFHGTSIQSAMAIQSQGWAPQTKHWTSSTGNPYVLTDEKEENLQECFKLAFLQANAVALKEPFICKRAVILFDIESQTLQKDTNHHPDFAYEVVASPRTSRLMSWDVIAIWTDEHDISEFRPFQHFHMKNRANFAQGQNYMTPMQKLIADKLQGYTLDTIEVPIVEKYHKGRYYSNWEPESKMMKL